ncbi:MAG: hypothetical protein HY22_12545 [[Candidatus Thermochlorobacteriaceae] bacterium GBChlB]|nr:MAG: hypothetical protein HY22_12545 [[Candidatus Thermochlorobacteriaceae] bacterium GBChlB]
MKTEDKNLSEITSIAMETLYQKIGVANTTQFLNQFTKGYGDYTKERRNFTKQLKLKEIIVQIKKSRRAKKK